MPLDRDKYVGQPTGKAVITMERQPISLFAKALKDNNPIYQSRATARDAGFDNIPAPPTWGVAMASFGSYPEDQPAEAAAIKSPIMEIIGTLKSSGGLVLHGEQEFEYHQPIVAGDTLSSDGKVVDVYEKQSGDKTMTFVVTENEYRNAAGELVLTTRMNLIHRS